MRTRIVPSSKIAECLYSAWPLSDDLQCGSAYLQCGSACQHDEQVPELCVHVLVQSACAASSAASIIRPSWRSTTDTQERNLKLQSTHVLWSPEHTGCFPILVSMIPRPAGVVGGGASTPSRWFHWRSGQELFRPQPLYLLQIVALLRSQSSDFVDECLHHVCLSLSLDLSPSPLLSCHVHDSRCTTQRQIPLTKSTSAPLPCQMEITRMGRFACVVECQSAVKQTWMTCG